jgi:hypothetical protein
MIMSGTQTPHDVLAQDGDGRHGGPYVITGRITSLADAQRIARSAHPARMLAHTNGYRYGRFTETGDGTVTVTLFGHAIATFAATGVRLDSHGYATASTTEAFGNLASGGWFYTSKGAIVFRAWRDEDRTEHPFRDGTEYPYVPETWFPVASDPGQEI